ncbi:C39 family peptidase [Patescibacteria group bacterium]|nr:C39 family peptidase [Patescibacteria group bacterium]
MVKNKKILQKIVTGFIALAMILVFNFSLFSSNNFSLQITKESIDVKLEERPEQVSKASEPAVTEPFVQENQEQDLVEELTKNSSEISKQIKLSVDLLVPFTSQSPFDQWDDLHNRAYEEAVLIMARHWLNNQKLDQELANQEILDSVQWQEENWGGQYNLSISNTVTLARQYFNLKKIYFTSISSLDDIKYQLSKGNLVITPMAGRILKNPYYQRPGPVYHMVVVKGYNNQEIITHDPGTSQGEDFSYANDIFLESIHDWPFALGENEDLEKDDQAMEVLKGGKVMIVVEKD